ncbi:MAG: hypothetical protein D6815_07640 [Candidatus Dadabacteria bacterium]|nr:MAG: hypothetical protein D6815_07640 [Candidatus Dadabacteria bacterium]
MSGTILQGAEFSNPVDISVCRLRLEGRALIDNTLGSPSNGERINVTVYESMYAGPQTRILADEEGGGEVRISYRDPAKPPVLLGQIKPAPTLTVAPALRGCPVCGNSEIDEGESCDDGNTVSGDGCRSDCQDEGCLAATPDWPNVALCEDYNDCTVDTCDPINHQCVNTVSCSDGIECTDDTCIGTTCQHTPNDLWCDDGNPCTDDVCNVTAGCVHANLNGVSCDDGDPCTLTGTCNTGICEVTDQRRASKSVIKARMLDGANNDRLVIKADFDLSLLASAPNVTGLNVDVYSPSGATVFSASIPASAFADKRGTGEKFQFKDAEGTTPGAGGTRLAVVRKITAKGIAKVKLKAIGNELGAAAGADVLSASMLFGADPASNDCVTAWMLQCRSRPGTTHCKS